jgi:hypothetical protein
VQVIKEWLILYKQGVVPDSNEIEWLTWSESAQQLLNKIFAGR